MPPPRGGQPGGGEGRPCGPATSTGQGSRGGGRAAHTAPPGSRGAAASPQLPAPARHAPAASVRRCSVPPPGTLPLTRERGVQKKLQPVADSGRSMSSTMVGEGAVVARVRTSLVCMLAVHRGPALLAQPAAATSTQARRILDGCEVGGGGNDIHSIESHYHRDKNRIDVTLRLCAAAKPGAVYRLHLDFAAPFVEQARGCADPTDAVIARGPKGHQGKGRSEVRGNLVRFFVPLDDLGVAS